MSKQAMWAGLVIVMGCRVNPDAVGPVLDHAESDLQRFLSAIPAGREGDFGFHHRSELERATLASPFRMAVLDPGGVSTLLDIWRLPVTVDGEYRVLLTVELRDGHLRCTEIGATGLAAELQQIDSAARVLLRVPEHGVDFVVGGERAWPLRSARRLLPLGDDPVEVVELASVLRRRVRR